MACYEKKCVVPNEKGIHLRPSYVIVKIIKDELAKFGFSNGDCKQKVFIRASEDVLGEADASSYMGLLSLAAIKGTELIVFCNHPKFKKTVELVANAINKMETFDS
jgi:phosphotransferase system HPr (HPr) family protein